MLVPWLAGAILWEETLQTVYLVKLILNWYWKWHGVFHLYCFAAILFLQVDSYHPGFELGLSVCSGKTLIGINNNFTWVCKWLLGSCLSQFTVGREGVKWFESPEQQEQVEQRVWDGEQQIQLKEESWGMCSNLIKTLQALFSYIVYGTEHFSDK